MKTCLERMYVSPPQLWLIAFTVTVSFIWYLMCLIVIFKMPYQIYALSYYFWSFASYLLNNSEVTLFLMYQSYVIQCFHIV
jgi:hypothetical protein